MNDGLFEASLGSGLFKKRVALQGRGKRGGARTLIAFKKNDRAFFVYGFSKNQKSNISNKEEKVYKRLAELLFSYSEMEIKQAIAVKELIEVQT